MKKIFSSFLAIAMLLAGVGMVNTASAATATDDITASMDVLSTITMACADGSVTMGAITGTGSSALGTNSESCNIKTNNTSGYTLAIKTTAAGNVDMVNANSDVISGLAAGTVTTPAQWAVAGAASSWGVRLSTASTTDDAKWGTTDDYAATANWAAVGVADETLVVRSDETTALGDDEVLQFGAQVGASKWQPTGTYTTSVTLTATTNL